MAKYCERCKEQVYGLPFDQPHLCADITKHLIRREKQVREVHRILTLRKSGLTGKHTEGMTWAIAAEIVAKLANMGVSDD
jgi:hypothetical protein